MPISDENKQADEVQNKDTTEEVPETEGEEVVVGEATIEEGPSTSAVDPLDDNEGEEEEEEDEEEDQGEKDDEDYEPEGMMEEEYLEYINKEGVVS